MAIRLETERLLGLEYLSVFGLPSLEYVDLAARLGCDFVSLNFGGASNRSPSYPTESLRTDAGLRRAVTQAAERNGIRISLVEGFAITPTISAEAYEADLDAVARMGARSICAVSVDKDIARTHDQFARLAEAAARRGLVVTTELGAGSIRNLKFARDALRSIDCPNFKLLIDAMHFFRVGESIESLSTLSDEDIGHVQLCDVPMPALIDNYMHEALFERRAPGEGNFPLRALIEQVHTSVPIGLEIPIRSLEQAGLGPETRLKPCVAKARQLLAPRH